MTAKLLVLDQSAVGILDAALIDDAWFKAFSVPPNKEGLRRVETKGIIYLLSNSADLDSDLLFINIGNTGVFANVTKPRVTFERIIRVALRHFNRNIALPIQWQPYHEGSRLSVYAERFTSKNQQRICFEQAVAGTTNIFAYAVTDGPARLDTVSLDLRYYNVAISGFLDALTATEKPQESLGNFSILLSTPLGMQLAGTGTLEEWYTRKLSSEQLKFVDHPDDRPIRLRGAAGTGKTQARAVKCLRDLYVNAENGGNKTIAFLTHSSALAHEVVYGMFCALDPSERWTELKTDSGRSRLWIGTLYELAQEKLNYERKGLTPLSLDGRDGRELQRLLINDAIDVVRKEPRMALGVLFECPDFARRMGTEVSRPLLIEELMNEFACILDAENIRKGTAEADRYVRASREAWQMALPTEAHRMATLEVHSVYSDMLRGQRLLSMDQMVADFGRYLSTHEWNQLRDRDGFDVIFVDEYHYFTRVEAMTLQSLFATRAETNGRWPLIMAYDLKQITSDAGLGGGLERFRNPGVGESVPVDFRQVFRSTPQIAAFLRDLDASFPAIDLEGEFRAYTGQSSKEGGDTPTLLEYNSDVELIDDVLGQATSIARDLSAGGSQVAVLCMNGDLFDLYRDAGRAQAKAISVTSREDLRELRYARSKCILSMPEYVAGLQFDTVFLIHADRIDLTQEHVSPGARRRYVSRAYVGAGRAARQLFLACSRTRGGPSEILEGPLRNGSLRGLKR